MVTKNAQRSLATLRGMVPAGEGQGGAGRHVMKKLLILLICLIYVLSPIDLVPDPLIIIGWLDDIAAIVWTVQKLSEGGANKKLGAG